MENKINIAELLKDCPKGMELYSPIFGEVYLDKIRPHLAIVVTTDKEQGDFKEEFLYDGRYGMNGECLLFPSKGKTTWEGFHRPFKDGDVIFTHANCLKVGLGNTWISIYKENRNGGVATYVDYAEDGSDYYSDLDGDKAFLCMESDILRQRFATEEEKQKLFDAIKANGYKWNAETKTLEKLVEPKFKVGDKIRLKENHTYIYTITGIREKENKYECGVTFVLRFSEHDNWELVPNKFDITTLKPFDKVLYRMHRYDTWLAGFYNVCIRNNIFVIGSGAISCCIPYRGNEHLLGTTDDCDDFYKTW